MGDIFSRAGEYLPQSWEYKDFVFKFKRGENFLCTKGGRYTYKTALTKFWDVSQNYILRDLQDWENEGWEPISETGPAALRLREFVAIKWEAGGWVWFTFVTIITAGVGLLMLPFGMAPYIEPVEYRVQMRRRKM